jgi:RNA polymerase-binding transcription factor DksA
MMKTPGTHQDHMHFQPRWAWHYQQLQSLHERLLEAKAVLATEAVQPLEPHSMDDADSATDEFDHNLALGLLSQEQDALYEVEAAMNRIRAGTYGLCEETGKPIPEARLRAVPWTRYTRAVQERLEQEGLVKQAHLGAVASLQGAGPEGLSELEEPEKEELLSRELLRHQREADLEAIKSGCETGGMATNRGGL